MSIVQEIIKITLDIDDTHAKYAYIPISNEYKNYTRQKDDIFTELITGAAQSALAVTRQTLIKSFDKAIPRAIEEAVMQAVKSNPNMTWTD